MEAEVTCPECGLQFKKKAALASHRYFKHGKEGQNSSQKWQRVGLHMTEADLRMLAYIQEFLGVGRAEAMRTSITLCATHLRNLEKKIGGPDAK